MRPIGLVFLLVCLRYLLGDSSSFNVEQIIILLIGGLVIGGIGYFRGSNKIERKEVKV